MSRSVRFQQLSLMYIEYVFLFLTFSLSSEHVVHVKCISFIISKNITIGKWKKIWTQFTFSFGFWDIVK